jgi:hypothetical protein
MSPAPKQCAVLDAWDGAAIGDALFIFNQAYFFSKLNHNRGHIGWEHESMRTFF